MGVSPSFVPNPFDNGIVGDAWHDAASEVPEIGSDAMAFCRNELEAVRKTGNSRSVLLHGAPGSGKTHLISRIRRYIAGRNAKSWLDSVFVYVRLHTPPGQVWRHIRRQLTEDILRRPAQGPSPLERILFRRLASPGSSGGFLDDWKSALEKEGPGTPEQIARGLFAIVEYLRNNGSLRTLHAEIFERLDDSIAVSRGLEIVTEKLIRHEHTSITEAWLKGESLSEADLARIGLSQVANDEDPEVQARDMTLQVLRLIGPGTPVALCFDQIEALQSLGSDLAGFFAFGNAAATLHDLVDNVLLVSCIQTQHLKNLEGILGSNYDRIAEKLLELRALTQAEARQLVESRSPGAWNSDTFSSLFASTGRATAREVITRARESFSTSAPRETLADLWEAYLENAESIDTEGNSEEILEHGLPLLLRLARPNSVYGKGSRDIQFTLEGAGRTLGFSICNQVNSNGLGGRLRRLSHEMLPPKQIVLVRDPRLPISPNAAKTQAYLRELTEAGARFVRPSVEAMAALHALRTLLSQAQAGDLAVNGETLDASTVEAWLAQHLSGSLQQFANEITEESGTEDVQLRERLVNLLDQYLVMDAAKAASELSCPEAAIRDCAQSSSAIGFLTGPPAVLFRPVAKGAA